MRSRPLRKGKVLVPAGDRNALRCALERLIADEGLRARLGEGARRRAAGFAADVVVPRFEEVYRAALEIRCFGR